MVLIRSIEVSPSMVNCSCAWASDYQQLSGLYNCPYTGAVTTRTATLDGFEEDESHTVRTADNFPWTTSHMSDEADRLGSVHEGLPFVPQFVRIFPPPIV